MCTILSAVPSVSHKRLTDCFPPQNKKREVSSMFLLTQCWNSEGWLPQNPWQWEQGVREVEQCCLEWALPGQTWRHLGQLTAGQLTVQEPSLPTENQRNPENRYRTSPQHHDNNNRSCMVPHLIRASGQLQRAYSCMHSSHTYTWTHTQRSRMHVPQIYRHRRAHT